MASLIANSQILLQPCSSVRALTISLSLVILFSRYAQLSTTAISCMHIGVYIVFYASREHRLHLFKSIVTYVDPFLLLLLQKPDLLSLSCLSSDFMQCCIIICRLLYYFFKPRVSCLISYQLPILYLIVTPASGQ